MAMGKKTILAVAFTLVLLASMLAGVQFVKVARANFGPRLDLKLTINSPQNMTYTERNVSLVGSTVAQVDNWNWKLMGNESYVSEDIGIKLDDRWIGNVDATSTRKIQLINFTEVREQKNEEGTVIFHNCFYNFTLPLKDLSEGSHLLVVNTDTDRAEISFTINTATPSPNITSSPSPTIEPTAKPTSTPNHQSGFLGTNLPLEYGYALLAVLVVLVVAGLSLAYFKKLRK